MEISCFKVARLCDALSRSLRVDSFFVLCTSSCHYAVYCRIRALRDPPCGFLSVQNLGFIWNNQNRLKGICRHISTHRAADNKGVPCSSNKGLVVVVVNLRPCGLGSSPDAWLALEIACSVFNTLRPAEFSRPAGRKVFPPRGIIERCL